MRVNRDRVLYVPYMNDHAILFSAAFRAYGINSETLPESDEASIETGRRYLSGKECLPMAVTLGDFLKKLTNPGDNAPKEIFLLMPTADGPCRFGQYASLQSLIIKDLGYTNVKMLSPDSVNGYSSYGGNLPIKKIRKLIWKAIVSVDTIQKVLWKTRPYETTHGETDSVFRDALEKLEKCIEKRGEALNEILKKIRHNMDSVKTCPDEKKPVIGVIGEIFCRGNIVSNQGIIRKIEEFGGEVSVSPMSEWFHYTTHLHKRDAIRKRDPIRYLTAFGNACYQTLTENRINRLFTGGREDLKEIADPPLKKILNNSRPYLNDSYRGEAELSLGTAVDMITRREIAGIINVLPFSCMPGLITTGVSKKLRENHNNFPWLNIDFDGIEGKDISTNLEAFIYRVSLAST